MYILLSAVLTILLNLPVSLFCDDEIKLCEEVLHPGAKIAIVSYSNKNISALATRVYLKKYAKKWGYDLFHYHIPIDSSRSQSWNNITMLQNHMNTNQYEWIAWFDSEIFITDQEYSLDSIINRYGTAKTLIAQKSVYSNLILDANLFLIRPGSLNSNLLNNAKIILQEKETSWDQTFSSVLKNEKTAFIAQRKILCGIDYGEAIANDQFLNNGSKSLLWTQKDFATNLRYLSFAEREKRLDALSKLFYPNYQNESTPCDTVIHPDAKIAVISLSTPQPDRQAFASITKEYLKEYCQKWGYDFFYYDDIIDPLRHPAWSKIPALQTHLGGDKYDWLVWLDDDILITNPNITLTEILNKAPSEKNLIAQQDCNKDILFNTGAFAIRNCEDSKKFLHTTISIDFLIKTQWTRNWEQNAMCYVATLDDYLNKILITNFKAFQSYFIPDNPLWFTEKHLAWDPEDFAAHMCSLTNTQRINFIKNFLKKTV